MTMRLLTIAALAGAAILAASTMLYAQGAPRTIWDGVYTAAQADHGKTLVGANCAKCHGEGLDGNDEIPPLKGAHFLSDWDAQTVADLVSRVHTTMPMDNPGALNIQSSTDVVAYLLQQNGLPAGNTALPADPGIQGQIHINAVKPGG